MTKSGRIARKTEPTAPVVVDEKKLNVALDGMREASEQRALVVAQHESAVRTVATQLGYHLPADSADPDLIQRDIAAQMRRSVEACLEVGRGLHVLKTACGHGNFLSRLEVLGIEHSVAQRFMQAAAKFSKGATSHLLKAAGTQSKLFELLILDDDQVDELVLTGQTGELDLDDVAKMGVRELRAAVRTARAEKDASDKLLERKDKKIRQLEHQIERAEPDEVLANLLKEAAGIANEAVAIVKGSLRHALIAIQNHDENDRTVVMAGLIGQVQADLARLREEFDLPDVSNASDQQLAEEVAQWAGK